MTFGFLASAVTSGTPGDQLTDHLYHSKRSPYHPDLPSRSGFVVNSHLPFLASPAHPPLRFTGGFSRADWTVPCAKCRSKFLDEARRCTNEKQRNTLVPVDDDPRLRNLNARQNHHWHQFLVQTAWVTSATDFVRVHFIRKLCATITSA